MHLSSTSFLPIAHHTVQASRVAFFGVAAAFVFSLACQTSPEVKPQEVSSAEKAKASQNTLQQNITVSAQFDAVSHKTPAHPKIETFLAPLAAEVNARANRVVGEIDTPMKRGKPESAMGNFVTDAMRTGMSELAGAKVDACFTNAGGLRVDFEAGKITEGMVVELMPFENAVVILQLSGARLRKVMARLAQRGDPISGITYTRVKGSGQRHGYFAQNIQILGKKLNDNKIYSLCTNDYIYEGGGRFGMEDIKDVRNTGILIRDVILHSFETAYQSKKIIHPQVEGRIQVQP